ncbi:LysR family transcriptional regulator [Terriglobus sp. ADX1]|uniref:LysR family transcriptional regulator n=1 Tax=Terriglobus sp. ADX1 TaxID=2794063 RepID=UPI002FE58E59
MEFDPTLLRALVAVKNAGNFTRAAQRLHLTQSAISHQIRRLEEQVGRPLLHRTTRSVLLTEDGHEFVRHAEQILTSFDSLKQRFQSPLISGVVRFGVPEMFMSDQLPHLIAQFSRAFPAIRLEVSVSNYLDLEAMIGNGELDLGVVISTNSRLKGTVLQKTQFVWAAADTFELPQGSLPFVLSPAPCVNRLVAIDAIHASTIEWHIVYTSPSHHGIRAAVLAGLGLTVMTRCEVESGMKIIPENSILPALPSAEYRLVWSAGDKAAAAIKFGEMLSSIAVSPRDRGSKRQQGRTLARQ